MRENNRKPIEKCIKKLPQFTTMNVIDGQAGLVIYSSLIFYSLTIYNILNIVVLLILAGVSIAMLAGENGIIAQAQRAKKETEEAAKKEEEEINNVGDFIDDLNNNVTRVDGVPIPEGFYYSGGNKDTGLVISDNEIDKKEYTEENKTADVSTELVGNQFVWIPVPDPSELFVDETVKLDGVEITTNVYSKLIIRDGDIYTSVKPGETGYAEAREPDIVSSYDTKKEYYKDILGFNSTEEMVDSMVAEYKAMSESVKKYKGFYIGRYELTGTVNEPTEKKGASLTGQNWYNLYKACQKVIKNNDKVKSTMIYGVQWDATMEWLKQTKFKEDEGKVDINSSSWGNYKPIDIEGSKIDTGSNLNYEANKIFDLAGNCGDWTQEANATYDRVVRGGDCKTSEASIVSDRGSNAPSYLSDQRSSRPILYMK